MTSQTERRGGDATATRAALRAAARELFAAQGFDHTTVRAIAERAGVNQALLFRYFGSKDALFADVLGGEARELLDRTDPEELLEATLRRMFEGDAHPLYTALRSPGHASALSAMRSDLGEPYRRAFTALAGEGGTDDGEPDPDAALRADLLLAWLFGIGFARSVLGTDTLVGADPEVVVAHVRRASRALLADGPETGPDEM